MLDFILLSASIPVLNGLDLMLEKAIGANHYVREYVDLEIALLIVEVAKLAPDLDEWFPRGKWATIQAIQGRCELELTKINFDRSASHG
jgi:hypothetical protein